LHTNEVLENYKHGRLLTNIKEGLAKMNLAPEAVTIDVLASVDEFHIGGRLATARLTEQLRLTAGQTVLDLGCGLGGAARYVAQNFNCNVEGLDLNTEYVETGNALNELVKLKNKINLTQGSVLELPYAADFFDGAYQIHVGMNIENKKRLFSEVRRVLKPGASFAIYDIMATAAGELQFPVPWASNSTISYLASPSGYKATLEEAGFAVSAVEEEKDFALDFFKKMKAKAEEMGGPPPLGLHTLMQASAPAKLQNMIKGVAEGHIAPVRIVCKKA
jgi:ubiquinone/menaquinone biosynthesis C-methylase UbiE